MILACLPAFIELGDLLRIGYVLDDSRAGIVVQLFLLSNYIHWGFAG